MRDALSGTAGDSLSPSSASGYLAVAAGKAAWRMAAGLRDRGLPIARGLVAGPRVGGVAVPASMDWIDAGHPSPDELSERAGRAALTLASQTRAGGTLVVLLSGGASSMMAAPADGVTLAGKAAAVGALMAAGVPIDGLNCVRKHLSAIKGGRLAQAAGRTVTFALSDVHDPIENDASVIGSGPTVPDPTTFADALRIARGSGAAVGADVMARLERGARGEIAETPKPGDESFARAEFHLIGDRRTAMRGAAAAARALGYTAATLEPAVTGEAREAGAAFVERARRAAAGLPGPVCVIASGETTVRVSGRGRGGRNQEFVLGAAPHLAGEAPAVLASAGTDGRDGPTDAAGAIADTRTAARALDAGLDWRAALAANASYDFFEPLGDLLVWGPTGTNVGDVHVLLIA